jgi:ribosomal protein L7/L12
MSVKFVQTIKANTDGIDWDIAINHARAAVIIYRLGHKVSAIKFMREEYPGMGLREAKVLCEELEGYARELGVDYIQPYKVEDDSSFDEHGIRRN